ncbi:putative inactive purple acid phosphatase 27 [Drosera capensis]
MVFTTFSVYGALTIITILSSFVVLSCSHLDRPFLEGFDPNRTDIYNNHTLISQFRTLNRRPLKECHGASPYVKISTSQVSAISDDQNITVTVSGILKPTEHEWIAMISPSHSSIGDCPLNWILYKQTGDFSSLPLLCHYPVKAAYLKNDPNYLSCNRTECKKHLGPVCKLKTCVSSITFHVINIRTDIEFVLFGGGFDHPCIMKRTKAFKFANPNKPLYGHISSIDSTATSSKRCDISIAMRLTWVSGDKAPQQVHYGDGKVQNSTITTFTQSEMCTSLLPSPAKDFGWHDPGYIHSAIMQGLKPSTTYVYKYGSDYAGWSDQLEFRTPPAGGSDEVRIIAYGDMGKAPRDSSIEHYIQPGSISVTDAVAAEVAAGNVDSIFHIGDISYATGFLVEWDYFLHLIAPLASCLPYMTAIGNHERDYVDSGSVFETPDSGGECGVPYEAYFPMPTQAKDKPWYSIEQGPLHFTIMSTEHDWTPNSDQYTWLKSDMNSVNRSRTPWLIFAGHRQMYSSYSDAIFTVDQHFIDSVEPLLLASKVDLVLFGHVHNYERTCAMYQGKCKAMPVKGADGVDTYDQTNYTAPVQAVIGMAGYTLDNFSSSVPDWSISRICKFGYTRIHAKRGILNFELTKSIIRRLGPNIDPTKDSGQKIIGSIDQIEYYNKF